MSNGLSNLRITYENSVTINTGNFQNERPGFTVSADVEEGTHPRDAAAKLVALVDSLLEAKMNDILEELKGQ
jgi:hypothetical protein